MDQERSVNIRIGGEEHALLLTTRATKEIMKQFGGLETLGDKLMQAEDLDKAFDKVVWLIVLLANQSILVHNYRHKDAPRELLTEEVVELLTSPADLARYNGAILEALSRGMARTVLSEPDPKNGVAG